LLDHEQIFGIVKNTLSCWSEDKAPRLAASLAYYTALSLAPLIVVVLAIAGLAFGRAAARGQLVWQIREIAGSSGARAIQALVDDARKPSTGIMATVLGLGTLFFGATSAVVELTDALNTIWNVKAASVSGIRSVALFLKERFFSFAMVAGIGFLLLVSLIVNAWLAAVGKYFAARLPATEGLLQTVNFVVSFVVITFLFAVIFRVLPDVTLKWSDVAIGAAVTSLLFTIGKLLIGIYLGKSTIGSAYGAAGSFVVLLVWVYYSALVFFLGAEFTKVYTRTLGSLSPVQPKPPAPEPRDDVVLVDATGAPLRPSEKQADGQPITIERKS